MEREPSGTPNRDQRAPRGPFDPSVPANGRDGEDAASIRRRWTTVFGWIAGGSAGLLVNYGLFVAFGEDYPTAPTTFATFLAGAFGGMALADRLGERGFRPLGIAAGLLLVAFASIVAAGLIS